MNGPGFRSVVHNTGIPQVTGALGGLQTHLEAAGEKRSTAGLFPEVYTGIDSTDPAVNGTLK